jgi:hypothetical protein
MKEDDVPLRKLRDNKSKPGTQSRDISHLGMTHIQRVSNPSRLKQKAAGL